MAKKSDIEDIKKDKKAYNFETDKGKKLDISMLFDMMQNNNSQDSNTNEPNPTVEFVIDNGSEDILNSVDVSNDDFTEETTEETTEEAHFNYRRLFVLFLLSCMITVILCIIWMSNSKIFLIKNINISDKNDNYDMDYFKEKSFDAKLEIYKVLRESIGNNLFLQDKGKYIKEIEKIPIISNIELNKEYPNSLEAIYTLRIPYSIISKDDKNYLIDKYGYILDNLDNININIPTVAGICSREYQPGEILDDTDLVKYKNIVFFLETAETINFEYKITNIDYTNLDKFSFYIEDADILVYYGEIEKEIMNDKLLYLKSVIIESLQKNLKGVLDISAEDYLRKSVLKAKYN